MMTAYVLLLFEIHTVIRGNEAIAIPVFVSADIFGEREPTIIRKGRWFMTELCSAAGPDYAQAKDRVLRYCSHQDRVWVLPYLRHAGV